MLGYNVFAPMNRSFYESMGGKFGVEYDPDAADYTYGKDSDSIAYCGPYVVKNFTSKNTIVFQANESLLECRSHQYPYTDMGIQ